MRRKDREVTEINDILSIIEKCEVCRIALCKNNMPYIVPLNFGYAYENEKLTLYFHCAKEGKKLDIMRENPNASFEMDCSHKVTTGERAIHYSYEYESVIGFGQLEEVTDYSEKVKGLHCLMKTYVKEKTFDFTQKEVDCVVVLKLNVSELTGKRHIKA